MEDLFSGGSRNRKLGHFSALVKMVHVDGSMTPQEESMLKRFARKLDIDDLTYAEIIKNPTKHPTYPTNSKEIRLKQLHDMLCIIYADHVIDTDEAVFLNRYAYILGFSEEEAKRIITRSIEIFSGPLDFYDYEYLLNRKK